MTAEVLYGDLYERYGKDLYIILHLTYEENQDVSYPKYELLDDIYSVKEYLVNQYENKTNIGNMVCLMEKKIRRE